MLAIALLLPEGLLLPAATMAPNIAAHATNLLAAADPVRTKAPNLLSCVRAAPIICHSTATPEPCSRLSLHDSRVQFLDPVWNSAQEAAVTATSAPTHDMGAVMTGLVFYGVTMGALTWWDEKMLPKLQDQGLMPTIPGTLRYNRLKTLSKEQRDLPWLTPSTAQYQGKQLPGLDDIVKQPIRIGEYSGVAQYLKAHTEGEQIPQYVVVDRRPTDGTPFDADELGCVCMVSPEFTEHYGKRVYLCKRRADLGEFTA
jgi:hypothetical protein